MPRWGFLASLFLPIWVIVPARVLAQPVASVPVAATVPTTWPATVPAAQVEALITQLSADDWHQRQKAEDQLVELGETAKPFIQRLGSQVHDDEIRVRCAAALARIDKEIAEGPTYITLHFKDAGPKEIFAELARQAHTEIKEWPEGLWNGPRKMMGNVAKVSVDIDRQPFWAAVAEVCEKTGTHLQQISNDGVWSVMLGQSDMSGPRCQSGQFMFVAEGATRSREMRYAPVSERNSDSLSINIFVDPKAHLAGWCYDPDISEATDDKGNSMGTHTSNNGFSMQRMGMITINVPMSYPNDGYTKLAKLRGKLQVMVATKTEVVEIPDMEKAVGTSTPATGCSLAFTNVKIAGRSIKYSMTIKRAGMLQEQWQNMFNHLQNARLIDAKGRVVWSGGGGGSMSDTEVTTSVDGNTGEAIVAPVKLVWELAIETQERAIPFEFTDLPLPKP